MSKYNNQIYKMYEEECNKNDLLIKEIKNCKLEISDLKTKLKQQTNKNRIEIEKVTTPLKQEISILNDKLDDAHKEIERLKKELDKKNYSIDKLECSINKNSSNSGIPTSKEIKPSKQKNGTNTYNHREKSSKKTGGQFPTFTL